MPAAASHGWVASMSREGEPWIEPAEFDCPPLPTDMESLLELPPGVGVHCFPNAPITVKARLLSCNCDVDGRSYTPQWFSIGGGDLLMEPERTVVPQDYSGTMALSLDPDGEHPDELPLGEVVEVTGVFDHPAASSCTFTEMDVDSRSPTRDAGSTSRSPGSRSTGSSRIRRGEAVVAPGPRQKSGPLCRRDNRGPP